MIKNSAVLLIVCAGLAVLGLVGCSNSKHLGPPSCDSLVGKPFPKSVADSGCMIGDELNAVAYFDCNDGSSLYQWESYWATTGGVVHKVTGEVTDDPAYKAAYTACNAASSSPSSSPPGTSGAPTAPPVVPALPVNSSHLLAGTAHPTYAAGKPGKLDVVYVGPVDRSENGETVIPIALRNNMSKAVSHIDVSAAVSVGGKIVITGTSQEVQPAQLAPGEVGLSYIYFEPGTSVPKHPSYTFTTESVPADSSSYNTATAKVTQRNRSGSKVAGSATNTTGKTLQGPYKVDVFCFDATNKLVALGGGGFADQDGNVPPSGTLTFTVDLYGAACPTYLVGMTGYYA